MNKTIEINGILIPYDLNRNGFDLNTGDNLSNSPFDLELIKSIRDAIKTNFISTPNIRINSGAYSYELKHIIEKFLNTNCSNGDLIYSMIAEGYKFKRDGINCFFNVDPKSTKLK